MFVLAGRPLSSAAGVAWQLLICVFAHECAQACTIVFGQFFLYTGTIQFVEWRVARLAGGP